MANKYNNTTPDPKKTIQDRAMETARSVWTAVGDLGKKAKNGWQIKPGESRRDTSLPTHNPHKNYDATDPDVSLENVRQGCPDEGFDDEEEAVKVEETEDGSRTK